MHQHRQSDARDRESRPIVAIHGSASSGALWAPLVNAFSPGRTILAPDLRGYGAQDRRCLNRAATLQTRAAPVVKAMTRLDRPVHLIAHSFGASVALQIVKTVPGQVRSLTFYEPVIPALLRDSGQMHDLELVGDLLAVSEVLQGASAGVGMETFVNFWAEPGTWQTLPEEIQRKLSRLAPIVYQDFLEAYHNTSPNTFSQLEFNGPVRLLLGARANRQAIRMAELLAQQYPQASTQTLRDMGHLGPSTHPEQVHSTIVEHIGFIEAGSDFERAQQLVING
ncbi:alpha/beta hydrolase [Seongchinamella unica]|uniref:Alpha/beta hydrolase n=1 Tax=Seongchinamella unica TaxID=2547392 RepID=A0A4R5LRD6_9GAMM|nr:alpha/beta hydrolase [Seongchinamella unica]TDG13438.1 alpha/beta hydrolase [Seongchinamella unica]